MKSRVDQAAYSWQAVLVVAKAYAVGKALHLAVYFIAMLTNSLLAALVMLGWSCSCLSTVVSSCERKSGNQLHKGKHGDSDFIIRTFDFIACPDTARVTCST